MKKKILIQITLLLFLSLVVFIFFNIYYKKDSNNLISSKKTELENAELVNANEGKDIIENKTESSFPGPRKKHIFLNNKLINEWIGE